MGKADEYRWRAQEAERQAKAAISRSARAEFERIANNWRDLARQAEQLDRMDLEAGPGEKEPD
jgi:2-polyprenyl-3-methyl-5-hydroxy-6-metoxy-1,4-benzoquinol methylase